MDADSGGDGKKRKAAASATLRKKPRRLGRDKSEFVSVEVGMREFKKRLAASGPSDATAAGTNTVEDLTQDVKATKTRVKSKTTTTKLAAARKTATSRMTAKKKTEKKVPVKKAGTTTKKTVAAKTVTTDKKMPAKMSTRATTETAASKMTLADVKAQLDREQKERVEYRIQTLRRETKSAAVVASCAPVAIIPAHSSTAPVRAVTSAPVAAAPVTPIPSIGIPSIPVASTAVIAPVGSPARPGISAAAAMEGQNLSGQSGIEATSAIPENHTQDTQAYAANILPTTILSAGTAPASSTAPPPSPVKNEFIADDVDEDIMFAMALEEVERKLATPQKSPPSSGAVAVTDSNSLAPIRFPASDASPEPAISVPVEPQLKQQSHQVVNAEPSRTEAVVETKEAEPDAVVAPDMLEEMERLRRENERLRRSNELLQAAVTSPIHTEDPADEQLIRSPEESTARDGKNESKTSPKDTSSDAPVTRPTARYLDLARCDSDQDMKQTVFGLEGDQLPELATDSHSTESTSTNPEPQNEDTEGDASALTNEEKQLLVRQYKPEDDKEPAAELKKTTEHASERSSAVTSQDLGSLTPLSDHSTRGGKGDYSPTELITTDYGNEFAPHEKAQPIDRPSSTENVDEHLVNATTRSDDGDVSDVSMSEADDEEDEKEEDHQEEESMVKDSRARRSSTIDNGNYAEYKVHSEEALEADEDDTVPVFEGRVNPALSPFTPVDSNPTDTLGTDEPRRTQTPSTPASSDIFKRITAPNDEEETDVDEVIGVSRGKRRPVITMSSSSSEPESESEEDEADHKPSSNVLEAALRAAGGNSGRKKETKTSSRSSSAAEMGVLMDNLQESKAAQCVAVSTLLPAVSVKSNSKKRKTPGLSATNTKKPPSVKNSLLWPTLDEFYDFLLDMSPRRNVRGSEQKTVHLQKYAGGKLPTQYSSIKDYCNVQLEAIMEELAASVSNTTNRRGGGGSGPTRHLSLASASPCGMPGLSMPSLGLSLGAIFSESGFSGNTSNNNDYILTFDASMLSKKAASDFMSGDLVLLRSPRWKNYEMCVYGVVLCDSVVAVGGKTGLGGKGGGGGSGESDQICVLIRAQQRDRDDAVENFSVLTELCLSNQRVPNWRWSMQQVHNTTTSAREFQAIKAVSFFPNDFKQVLQRGLLVPATKAEETPKKSMASSSIVSPRLLQYLHKHYNDSQVQAILGCLGEDSRVIIQGPPGTGKTKTILGLLSALLDGAGLSTLHQAKGTARIRVGASLQSARTSAVSKTVAETSIRVLVAAPSNAAVDELVVRVLSGGLFDGEKGEAYRPRIVRVGRPESSQQLSSLAAAREASESKKTRKKMRKYAREVEEVLLESLVTKHRNTFPTVKQTRQAIIKNAQIVFCTLSGAGSVAMCEFAQDFDALIIDEAAQAVEASTLIPFKFRPHRVVLVGDHRQLPATVISKKLVSMGYDRSLQQRLVENGSPVLLLNQQYRMHPEIAEFPSSHFYGGRLVQDDNMREWTAQDYHRDRAFKPLLFLDVQGAQSQVSGSTSLRNMSEVEAVIQLVRRLLTKFPRIEWKKRIGVIAPYKQQIFEVRSAIGKLETEFDRHLGIEVNTVDGFQGREKEIIIYSCVRTSYAGRRKKKRRKHRNDEEDDVLDAFWADERRMNVAITRAKSSLWIVGNSTLLKQSRAWRALIQHTKDHSRYISDGASTLFAASSSTRMTGKTSSKAIK